MRHNENKALAARCKRFFAGRASRHDSGMVYAKRLGAMKAIERDRRRRNVAAMLRYLFPSVTPPAEHKAAVKAVKCRLSGGRADRSTASAIRRRRLAALAPLARAVHDVLDYDPDDEKRLRRLSRTALIDELHIWLWKETDRWEAPEGVSVKAIASDQELWPDLIARNGKLVKRYKRWTPDRRTFRDLFRGMSIDDILNADNDPAPAEGMHRAR